MADDSTKIIHPGIKDSRVQTYLNQRPNPMYENTAEESELLYLWHTKYTIAKQEYEKSRCNSAKVKIWRDAYEGRFFRLDEYGKPTEKTMKPLRKLAFEIVEGKVQANVPAPKMSPRYHADLTPVNATEALISHEMDRMLSEEANDESEHNVLIDGMSWFKVEWNPFDNTHERSGNPLVLVCPVDTVFPQPGVTNYKFLEYIFEEQDLTVAQCIDLYNREIRSPDYNDIIPVVNCYFLNENRLVGKFTWCDRTMQVLGNDLEWGIRKRRECVKCHEIAPIATVCPICGSKDFKYVSVKEYKTTETLDMITDPYRSGQTRDISQAETKVDEANSIPEGTVIPHYLIRQLPFVPYRRIRVPKSIYGIGEVEVLLENQDWINKLLNKAEKKSSKSQAYVTKMKDTRITDKSDELSFVEVESPQECAAIQVKQITADITEEVTMATMAYDNAKSTAGVTNTDQGKNDPSARSGKAKQIQLAASASRNAPPDTLRNASFAGVYELIFKNMLAYADENRSFVSLLPDGTQTEQVWSKYMFLDIDKNGDFYYRDDFAWSVDTASEITQDRAAMWQMIDTDYLNGTMGSQVDPTRALLMFWQMKEQVGYPTAKYAVAFLKDAVKHLPTQIEQALVNNPEAVELALSFVQDAQSGAGMAAGQGGARANAGKQGNGQSHSANVAKTNEKNRAQAGNGQTNKSAEMFGGMQGGTGNGND